MNTIGGRIIAWCARLNGLLLLPVVAVLQFVILPKVFLSIPDTEFAGHMVWYYFVVYDMPLAVVLGTAAGLVLTWTRGKGGDLGRFLLLLWSVQVTVAALALYATFPVNL